MFYDYNIYKLNLSERVRALLVKFAPVDFPGLTIISDMLHMSSAAMRRKLADEKSSFQKIKDDIRCETAHQLLLYSDSSTEDIANELGFQSSSAFYRSFKNWTGMTPKQYKASHAHHPL